VAATPDRQLQALLRATSTAIATSAAVRQRAIKEGRRSIIAFQTARAPSYAGSSGL
jgi:hypothetical protein